jgi:hypothetical protein
MPVTATTPRSMIGPFRRRGGSVGFTEDYIDTYNSRDVERFVAQFAPNGRYSDVTMRLTYDGLDEIRRVYQQTVKSYVDFEFTHVAGAREGNWYAIEWTHTSRSRRTGEEFTIQAMSSGDLDDQGRILENRDYWNPAHYPSASVDPADSAEHLKVEAAAWVRLHPSG